MIARAMLGLIFTYQHVISPWLPRTCRFAPTCSEYTRVAIQAHGAARGAWLGILRLLRCHPFHTGGFDPPPPARSG